MRRLPKIADRRGSSRRAGHGRCVDSPRPKAMCAKRSSGVRIIDSPAQPLWIICIRSTTLDSISRSRRDGESRYASLAIWQAMREMPVRGQRLRVFIPAARLGSPAAGRGIARCATVPGAERIWPVRRYGTTVCPARIGGPLAWFVGVPDHHITAYLAYQVPVSEPATGMTRVVHYLFLGRRYAIETGFDAGRTAVSAAALR